LLDSAHQVVDWPLAAANGRMIDVYGMSVSGQFLPRRGYSPMSALRPIAAAPVGDIDSSSVHWFDSRRKNI
jgi:hypothetical protein